jgi:lysyl-tRNA synthetase class I
MESAVSCLAAVNPTKSRDLFYAAILNTCHYKQMSKIYGKAHVDEPDSRNRAIFSIFFPRIIPDSKDATIIVTFTLIEV